MRRRSICPASRNPVKSWHDLRADGTPEEEREMGKNDLARVVLGLGQSQEQECESSAAAG